MFISSMARKNVDKQRDMERRRREMKRRSETVTQGLSIKGKSSLISTKGFEKGGTVAISNRKGHQRANSAPLPRGAPKYNVKLLQNENGFFHEEEINDVAKDIEDDIEDNFWREESGEGHEWYLNPVHRPYGHEMSFSELLKTRPLTASLVKAANDGTLPRDCEEDISALALDEINMDLFKETDFEIYRNGIRKSLKLHSPFELQLAKLKHEKLKLEEAYILQKKCKAELEETRGPKPRWYEMKTSQFTTEHKKHNNLLVNSRDLNSLVDYRNQLIEASGRWKNLCQ